jgi:hypothetical protein
VVGRVELAARSCNGAPRQLKSPIERRGETVNTKTLANHYSQLSAEERFRLIVAACNRGDEAERQRLRNASPRITFSNTDYSPFAQALEELAILVFIELLEEAAMYRDAFERWSDAEEMGIIDAKKETPATAKKDARTIKDRSFDLYLAQGFVLRTKAAGWKLFCDRLGNSPFGLWQYLPGFERLQSDLKIVEGTPDNPDPAFTPKGMTRWLNRIRPAGKPEVTEADIMTAVRVADALDVGFRECVKWWGG